MLVQILLLLAVLYVFLRFAPKNTLRFLSRLCIPFVRFYILRRIADGLEEKNRVNERFGLPSQKKPNGKLIWIHAVSVGETLSVIPIIDEIKKLRPNVSILLTTTTVTAAKQVEQRLKDKVIHQYVPFDVFMWIRRFVKYWKPSITIFVESELWANTLYYLHDKRIPIYLMNARISERSLKRMFLVKRLFGILPFSLFKCVYTTTPEMKDAVQKLGALEVQILPNLKTLSDKLPVNEPNKKKIANKVAKRKAWMAVSTHPGEEEIVINVHKNLKITFPEILTVIAIRHPSRKLEVQRLAISNGLTVAIYSETLKNRKHIKEDLLLIDEIGCLGDFFEIVDTVLVCGSLIPGIGGHNFLEPLNFGCNVATGKYIDNFKDTYTEVSEYCKIMSDEGDIAKFVSNSLEDYVRKSNIPSVANLRDDWSNAIKGIVDNI